MKVLIVEDDKSKARAITTLVEANLKSSDEVLVVSSFVNAQAKLKQDRFDLLLLDLRIPKRFGDNTTPDGGVRLLKRLFRNNQMYVPGQIVAITGYGVSESVKKYLYLNSIPVVEYQASSSAWESCIKNLISWSVRRELIVKEPSDQSVDVCILTAVDVETKHVRKVFSVTGGFIQSGVAWQKAVLKIGGVSKTLVLAQASQMGMPATSVLTTKAISLWKPKLIVMVGICAGVKGEVEIGDIVVPNPCWDYGSGKLVKDGVLKPDPRQIPLPEIVSSTMFIGKDSAPLRAWWDEWMAKKPRTPPRVHVGPSVSGAAVVANEHTIPEVVKKQSRKIIGLDMESYGLYFSCSNSGIEGGPRFVSVKTVVDFANSEKGDDYQDYGSSLSANFAKWLIQNTTLAR